MDKKLETLYELCDTVSKELESANEKINNAGGELSAGDLDYLDKLTHTLKSLKCSIMYMENDMDGSSGYYYDPMESNRMNYARGGRNGSYTRNTYRSGRMGNYARGGRSGHYDRGESREDFIMELEELIEKAPDEKTKMEFERMLNKMQ